MAYQNSTASSIDDLFNKLATFAQANGWTKNEPAGLTTDRLFLSKNSVFVSFRWALSSQTAVGVYQATGYAAGLAPGGQANDSGNGFVGPVFNDANVKTSRYVSMTHSDMTYWFFENDSSPAYIHVVVTLNGSASNRFSHFGFGELTKLGTWTGGEYAYGQYVPVGIVGTDIANTSEQFSCVLDGGLGASTTAYRAFAATVRMESLPGQTVGTRWGLSYGGENPGVDRGNNVRYNIQGGFRAGPVAATFARFMSSPTTGLTAMYPINLYYDRGLVSSVRQWYPMGYMADVRGIDITNYSEAQELTVGADTWVAFPASYKVAVFSNNATKNTGVAYKKVTA